MSFDRGHCSRVADRSRRCLWQPQTILSWGGGAGISQIGIKSWMRRFLAFAIDIAQSFELSWPGRARHARP
jgi:hypothetical protein